MAISQSVAAQGVNDDASLAHALQTAVPGAVIALQDGTYGRIELVRVAGTADAPITITSQDPSRPARISGLGLHVSGHIVISDLIFDYRHRPGDPGNIKPFQIIESEDITLRRLQVTGGNARGHSDVLDGYGFGIGLWIRASQNIRLEESHITGFARAAVFSDVTGLHVTGNLVEGQRSDGFNFVQVRDVGIIGNVIQNFRRNPDAGDHADMIQFWTRGTDERSENITIRDNILNSGQGLWTQSIFMRNEVVDTGARGVGMFYKDVSIVNNLIINAHLHGITVGESDNLLIANNTLVRNVVSRGEGHRVGLSTPAIHVKEASRRVRVADNMVASINGYGGQQDWDILGNIRIQDQSRLEPGFYGAVYGLQALQTPSNPDVWRIDPAGVLAGSNAGYQHAQPR